MSKRYTKDHEYILVSGESGVVGISAYAQEQLGDIVFVELPEIGARFEKGEEAAVVESVKAASEIYAPASGTVTEVNERLGEEPGLLNADPEGEGWIFKLALEDPSEAESLLDARAYADHTA